MPCENPGYTFSTDPFTSFADSIKPDARNLIDLVEWLLAEKEPTAKT